MRRRRQRIIERVVGPGRPTNAARRTAALACTLAAASAHAGSLYLDVNGSAAGSGVVQAQSYTWDATTTYWSADPNGASAVQAWDPGSTAVFSAGSDATGTVSVTVRSIQSAAGIVVEEGNVTLNSGSTATISLSGGPIHVPAGRTLVVKPIIAGSTFTKTGPGLLALQHSSSTFTGGFAVTGGTLQFAGENILIGTAPSITGATPTSFVPDYARLDGGAIQDTSTTINGTLLNPNKGIYLGAGGGTIDISDASTTNPHAYAGPISGPGSLTKSGPGLLLLSSLASTYAGPTSVTQGTLRLGASNALPSSTSLNVATGATFDMASLNQTVGALSGTGKVISAGRLTVAPQADVTWSGTLSGPGGITAAGPAFLVLAAAQTYTGPTIISGSPAAPFGLRIGAAGTLPAATNVQFNAANSASSPTLDLNGYNQTLADLVNLHPGVGRPTLTNNSTTLSTLTLSTPSYPVDITIAGSIALTKTGTGQLILAAPNTYSGPTRVSAGTLVISHPAHLGNEGPNNGLILDGGTLRTDAPIATTRTLTIGPAGGTVNTNGSDSTISGAVDGFSTLTKTGAGTLTLGPLSLPSLVISVGQVRLAPGSAGTSKLGALTIAAGCRFDLTDNRLVFTGLSSATLATQLAAGRVGATPGDWLGITGIASSAATPTADPTATTAIGYATAAQLGITSWGTTANLNPTDVLTRFTYYGDLNLDGRVNADDFAMIDRSIAKGVPAGTATWIDGDVNYDRSVTAADYLLLDRAFALHGGALSPDILAQRESRFGRDYVIELVSSVPEPALPGLAGATLAAASTRPRRRR